MNTNPPTAPVLVVGGGPVGLAAAIELSRFGIGSIVLERRPEPSDHPKTRNLSTRTMEIARGWGHPVYQRLRGIDLPASWKSPFLFFDTLTGTQLGHIDTAGFAGPGPDVSPAVPTLSSQDLVERILRDAAAATGLIDLRPGHRVTRLVSGWRPADTAARVEVHDQRSGTRYTVSGSALVAADGADSLVRDQLGIALHGARAVHHFVNCYFHADIESHLHRDRHGVLLGVRGPAAAGIFQPLDARGRWLCQIPVAAADFEAGGYDADRCRRWIRAGSGIDELEVDVRSVGYWRMNATVAERFVAGRVALVGDAAHQFPPTGGLGVNTGLAGMHNAMWKLALCVRGLAGWSLLDTYDAERRGPATTAVAQSLENFANISTIGAALAGGGQQLDPHDITRIAHRYGNHFGVEFGTGYASPAVIADGTVPPEVPDPYSDYRPSATPGCRAPHVWLGDGAGRLSTVDLFGPGFTLLTTTEGRAWRHRAALAAERHRVPVAAYAIGSPGLPDTGGAFTTGYGIKPTGAVLVRPDGHVAWRSPDADDTDNAVDRAMDGILGASR